MSEGYFLIQNLVKITALRSVSLAWSKIKNKGKIY